jgi:hypothetical protein
MPTPLRKTGLILALTLGGILVASRADASSFEFRVAVPGLKGTPAVPDDSVSTASLDFGSLTLGATSAARGVQLNNTGNTTLAISQVSASGNYSATQNCGFSVALGSSCSIAVTFTPENINANPGLLSIVTSAGTQTVTLTGIGQQAILAAAPTSLAFSTLLLGQSSPAQTVTLTNSGNIAATGLSITPPAGYTQTNTCGTSLASNASCSISLTFSPTAQQPYNATMQVSSSAGTQGVSLTGTGGAAAFAVSTSSLTLPSAGPGTTSSASVTVTNNGSVAATPTLSASSGFSATSCGTLAPGASCTPTVTFAPTVEQAYSGSLTVSGGSSVVQTVTLNGDSRVSAVPMGGFPAPSIVVYSPDKTYWLDMQSNCDLVEYHNGVSVWSSNTANGATNCGFAIQGDGNLVVYEGPAIPANAVWNSVTGGHAATNTFLQMGNDGIFHMYEGTIGNPILEYWEN